MSDRLIQSQPSVDLVMCLLDFKLSGTMSQNTVIRLGSALAACAQLSTLSSKQRTWAIKQLEHFITSPQSGRYLTVVGGSRSQASETYLLIVFSPCDMLSTVVILCQSFRGQGEVPLHLLLEGSHIELDFCCRYFLPPPLL